MLNVFSDESGGNCFPPLTRGQIPRLKMILPLEKIGVYCTTPRWRIQGDGEKLFENGEQSPFLKNLVSVMENYNEMDTSAI